MFLVIEFVWATVRPLSSLYAHTSKLEWRPQGFIFPPFYFTTGEAVRRKRGARRSSEISLEFISLILNKERRALRLSSQCSCSLFPHRECWRYNGNWMMR